MKTCPVHDSDIGPPSCETAGAGGCVDSANGAVPSRGTASCTAKVAPTRHHHALEGVRRVFASTVASRGYARAVPNSLAVNPAAINPIDATSLIEAFGLIGVLIILFAETGLLIGFFFPGDSLLFTAGFFASGAASAATGVQLPLMALLGLGPICAIAGAQLGHYLGAKSGPVLFNRPDSRLFKREYVKRAEYYFERFGPGKAVVIARFIPIVRTFLNPVAGVLEMDARRFFIWNVVGAILWVDGVTLLGYFLGRVIPGIDRYLLPAAAIVIFLSVLPILSEIFKAKNGKSRARP
jgi:membrane-associated protein